MRGRARCSKLAVVIGVVAALTAGVARAQWSPLLAEAGFDDYSLKRVLATLRDQSPELHDQIERQAEPGRPVIVLVPGMLGSTLVNGCGRTLWGARASTGPASLGTCIADLGYNQGQVTNAGPLDLDDLAGLSDGYRLVLATAQERRWRDDLLVFAYDWRADSRQSAERLDQALRSAAWAERLQGRELLLVAHDVGALVARFWYGAFFDGAAAEYPFQIADVMFLGDTGAGAALAFLIGGAEHAFPKASTPAGLASVDRVAHTFPSLYHWLPGAGGAQLQAADAPVDLALFDVDNWQRFDWLGRARADRPPTKFYPTIAAELTAAAVFHNQLTAMPEITKLSVYDLPGGPAPWRLAVEETGAGFRTRLLPVEPTDPSNRSLADLRRDLERYRQAGGDRRVGYARAAKRHPQLLQAFVDANVLLPMPLDRARWRQPDVVEILTTDQLIVDAMRSGNRTLLPAAARADQAAPRPAEPLYTATYEAAKVAQDPLTRAQLYALTLAMEPPPIIRHFAANNLAHLLWEQRDLRNALAFAEIATETPPGDLGTSAMKDALGRAFNNLGAIRRSLGDRQAAAAAFARAAELGNANAALSLRSLH